MLDSPQMANTMTTDTSDQPSEMTRIFEPPRGLILTAISRNKLLVLAVAVILAVVGLIAGVTRKPTYMAAATLQVGTVNLNSPSFDGFVVGSSEFATVFSRAILAAPVLSELKSKLGVTPSEAARRLSSEPIPLSPSFRIFATGSTAKSAIDLANVTSSAVIAYEQRAASETSPRATALLKEYESASRTLQHAAALVHHLSANSPSRGVASSMPDNALIKARAVEGAARVRADAIDSSYRNVTVTAAGAGPTSGLVSLVAAAVATTNDHKSKIEFFGLVGLLAGLVIGSAVAVLREQRRQTRQTAMETEVEIRGSKPS